MSDKIDSIRQRLELAKELPESFGSGNSAADRWHEDVTALLAVIDQLRQENLALQHQRIYGAEMAYDLPLEPLSDIEP